VGWWCVSSIAAAATAAHDSYLWYFVSCRYLHSLVSLLDLISSLHTWRHRDHIQITFSPVNSVCECLVWIEAMNNHDLHSSSRLLFTLLHNLLLLKHRGHWLNRRDKCMNVNLASPCRASRQWDACQYCLRLGKVYFPYFIDGKHTQVCGTQKTFRREKLKSSPAEFRSRPLVSAVATGWFSAKPEESVIWHLAARQLSFHRGWDAVESLYIFLRGVYVFVCTQCNMAALVHL